MGRVVCWLPVVLNTWMLDERLSRLTVFRSARDMTSISSVFSALVRAPTSAMYRVSIESKWARPCFQ